MRFSYRGTIRKLKKRLKKPKITKKMMIVAFFALNLDPKKKLLAPKLIPVLKKLSKRDIALLIVADGIV